MGTDALEHLILCLCPAELHGWLHHMGNYTTAQSSVRETRLLILPARSHYRHLASRLLGGTQAVVRRRRDVRSARPLSLQQIRHELASCSSVVRCLDSAHAWFCQRSMFCSVRKSSREGDADASKVTPSLDIAAGARHLASLGYLYGFFVSAVVYILLSRVFVARQTMVKVEHGSV